MGPINSFRLPFFPRPSGRGWRYRAG
jgi:hypothetical protein